METRSQSFFTVEMTSMSPAVCRDDNDLPSSAPPTGIYNPVLPAILGTPASTISAKKSGGSAVFPDTNFSGSLVLSGASRL